MHRAIWVAALAVVGLLAWTGPTGAALDGKGGGFRGGVRQAGGGAPQGGKAGPGGKMGCQGGKQAGGGKNQPGGGANRGCKPVAPQRGPMAQGCRMNDRPGQERPGNQAGCKGKKDQGQNKPDQNARKKEGGQRLCHQKDQAPPPVRRCGELERGCRQVARCQEQDRPGKPKEQPGQCVGKKPRDPLARGNNGVGNGVDPQPPGDPPINDGPGARPGQPGNRAGGALAMAGPPARVPVGGPPGKKDEPADRRLIEELQRKVDELQRQIGALKQGKPKKK